MHRMFTRWLSVVYSFVFFYYFFSGQVIAYFTEEFNNTSLDQNVWTTYQNQGSIEVLSGELQIKRHPGGSNQTPYIHSNANTLFPLTGPFTFEIRFKYTDIGNFGTAITLSADNVPGNGINPDSNLNSYMNFMIYQDGPNGLSYGKIMCDQTGQFCSTRTFLRPFTHLQDTNYHTVKIFYSDDGQYSIYIDNTDSPEFVSAPNQPRPKYVWLGNSMITNTADHWGSIHVDYIRIKTPESTKAPIIILPGFGGSWDVDAILTNTPGNNWKIPDFVKEYDGIINSLKNAGYKENEDLFVFAYDWRKPLNTLADDLNNFMISKSIHNKKTNLVGHSMGGLVARTYLQKYNNPNVNKVITAGSPHKGILDAYAMWEGLTVWDAVWWQKAMHLIATEVNRDPGELKIDAARRNTPSVKDLLPTDPFLKIGKNILPISNMVWKNDMLAGLNSQVSSFTQKIVSGFSISNQTKSNLSVSKATKEDLLKGLWEDGKPVTKNPFSYNVGDGYVTSSSSGSLFGNTVALDGWHGETISKKENIVKILSELGVATESAVGSSFDNRKKFLVFKLNSPGNLSVCLANICNEQIGRYFATQKMLIVPGFTEGDYKVEILAQGETGKYELVTGKIDEEQDWDSLQGELKNRSQTDSYLYNTKASDLVPERQTANSNLLSLFPSGVDPRRVNKIRQEVLKKLDSAMKTNDTAIFDNEIAKWSALDVYVQTMELSIINWFSFKDWDEHHFGLYKAKYLPKTKSYFNETIFTLVADIEESSKFVNNKNWLKVLDKKVQLVQLQHFLGHR